MAIQLTQKLDTKTKYTGLIIENKKISTDTYKLIIENKNISQLALPGQFISILCPPLLIRRPFSIAGIQKNQINIIYKLKGKGTEYISSLKPNTQIELLGPLGKGFTIHNKRSLLIGAGVGTAPILFLYDKLKLANLKTTILSGFQTSPNIEQLYTNDCLLITEDGSSGYKGQITQYIENKINSYKPEIIYACGPKIVLKQIVNIANKRNIETEIALEEIFACGIGACMGCAIEIIENNRITNKRICKDGPVFKGDTIVW
ncbi:MAG: dihydroorotate dehydrogenase electron transfer subunit [Vampirovibrionia bacterium]